jgi:glycosyltransferase involved in cell wall biosynthesis
MYGGAFHTFVMGSAARESLIEDYEQDPSRITVVGGGLSFETFPPVRKLAIEPRVLFVGRDFERKGGDCLLRAFALVRKEIPSASLHIAGAAPRDWPPGVVSHGKISDRDELIALYRHARVFTLPSHYEPYGLVLLEAMAHGLPCVGTEVQAIPEMLGNGQAGLLVPPGEVEPLAAALIRLLTRYDTALQLGSTGRRLVEEGLTWDHVAERMVPALLHAVPSRGPTDGPTGRGSVEL